MTRTLSVFNLMKRVGFALLFCGVALAQPQAPITWGETELLGTAATDNYAASIGFKGDSIALFGVYTIPIDQWYPRVSISTDDGETWSPWHTFYFPPPRLNDYRFAWAVFTMSGISVCTQTQAFQYGFFHTLDNGFTWQDPVMTRGFGLWPMFTRGDTMFCRETLRGVIWSVDGGRTFAEPWHLEVGNWQTGFDDISASASHIQAVIVSTDSLESGPYMYYTRSPLLHGPFEPLRRLNPELFFPQASRIEFDDEGVGMIVSTANIEPPGFTPASLVLNVSRDDGETWSHFNTIRSGRSVAWDSGYLTHEDHRWILVWTDSTREDFEHGGHWYCFSGNQGRSWCAPHQIQGEDTIFPGIMGIELRGNRVRLYAGHSYFNGVPGSYWVRWEGEIHEDSLSPTVLNAMQLPAAVPADTTLPLEMVASDNDSLWLTQVVAWRSGLSDTLFLPLEHAVGNVYQGAWHVSDTAIWNYYYHAEDMWENVAYAPSDGPSQPWTIQVGPDLAVAERPALPDALSLSVFPNPVNGILRIRGLRTSRSKPQALTVFDILGREVANLHIPAGTGPEFVVSWNLKNDSGRPIPTGTYIIGYPEATHFTQSKITVIR